jgi:Probable transposase.
VDSHTGQAGHATVNFSQIGDFHSDSHRPLPNDAGIIEVIFKKQKMRNWTVDIAVECPDKPAVKHMNVEGTVGIDLDIIKFVRDSESRTFARLDGDDTPRSLASNTIQPTMTSLGNRLHEQTSD